MSIESSIIFEKLSKSPWSLVVTTLMIVLTILGSHFATTSDLSDLSTTVYEVREDVTPLTNRVDNLEKDVQTLDEDLSEARSDTEDLEDDFHKIDVALERMSGNQAITNERLENLRDLIQSRDGRDRDR